MITRKNLLVVILSTFCLTAVLFSAVPVNSAGTYDPWIDTNHDGRINVLDLIKVAGGIGTSGDPGLTVSLSNWPNATDTTLFFGQPVNNQAIIQSWMGYANGFSNLHILARAEIYQPSDTVTLTVFAALYNSAHTSDRAIKVFTQTFSTSYSEAAFTIPVPGEVFYFQILGSSINYAYFYLSYYPTWD